MAELPSVFDATEEVDDPFAALPAGWYTATIVESAMNENKAKTGHYLKLKFKINGGQADGKFLFEYLNLDNPSDTAVAIAKRAMKEICEALDMGSVTDSEELHGQPLKVKLKVTPASEQYGEGNAVEKYAGIDEAIDDEGDDDSPF